MRAEAATPEHRAVGQHQCRISTRRRRSGRIGLEVGQGEAGGGNDRAPMRGRHDTRLSPFPDGILPDAGKARGLFQTAEAVHNDFHSDHRTSI
jgi:hypothetical protein